MLQLMSVLAVGVIAGWLGGRLMESVIRARRADLVVGALGALAAFSLARWWQMPRIDHIPTTLALAAVGALALTFVVRVAMQWRQPGPWVALRERSADTAPAAEASPARSASRDQPLLVLQGGHTLRCWPADGREWTRGDGGSDRLDWMVEVDGMREHQGPSSSATSSRGEVTAHVRAWWDGMQLATAASRGTGPA